MTTQEQQYRCTGRSTASDKPCSYVAETTRQAFAHFELFDHDLEPVEQHPVEAQG